jgi:hypothetical protein
VRLATKRLTYAIRFGLTAPGVLLSPGALLLLAQGIDIPPSLLAHL